MKLIVPTNSKKGLDDEVAEHFGRCFTYTLLNEKGEVLKIIDNTSEHMGGTGLPPELMKKHEADILLCRGIGLKAINLCKELGIKVYVFQADKVKEIFDFWQDNKIKEANIEDACK